MIRGFLEPAYGVCQDSSASLDITPFKKANPIFAFPWRTTSRAVCYHSPIDFRDGELSSLPPDYVSKTTFPAFITVNCNRLIFIAVF